MTDQGTFRDHFSGHAADYSRFRPRYPKALFEWLATHDGLPQLIGFVRRRMELGLRSGRPPTGVYVLDHKCNIYVSPSKSAKVGAGAPP